MIWSLLPVLDVRLIHCATALAWSLVQLPVRLPCALCGSSTRVARLLWHATSQVGFGGPLTWRSAHTVAGPAAPGPCPLAYRCGDCWWCHDEAHCAQHHRPWGVEFRRPRQAAVPFGVPLLPTCSVAWRSLFVFGLFSARLHEAPCSWQLLFCIFSQSTHWMC